MREIVAAGLLLCGSCFMLLAALGIVRMPDLFTRMQPATKAATLGAGCMLGAVAVHFGTLDVGARALAAVGFVVLTSPVAAHMIARAAYIRGERLWEKTTLDELRAQLDPRSQGARADGEADTAERRGTRRRAVSTR